MAEHATSGAQAAAASAAQSGDVEFWVSGWVTLGAALHIGGLDPHADADSVFARDGQGRPIVPGTSLAGVLRTGIERLCGDEVAQQWFGFVEGENAGAASRVIVDDGLITAGTDTETDGRTFERPGIAIDRRRGSVHDGLLFSRELVAAGSALSVSIGVESRKCSVADAARVTAALHDLLRSGDIALGAATNTGTGTLQENELRLSVVDLRTAEGVIEFASNGPKQITRAELDHFAKPSVLVVNPPRVISVSIPMSVEGPLLVKSGSEGFSVDAVPYLEPHGEARRRVVIPGSSVRGVLRSRAEYIVRSLLEIDAPEAQTATQALTQFQGLPLVEQLFGQPAREGSAKGWLRVNDLRGPLVDNEVVDLLLTPRPEAVSARGDYRSPSRPRAKLSTNTLNRLGAIGWHPTDHVAIDRFTGGAADALLFNEIELHGIQLDGGLRLTVRLPESRSADVEPAIVLLLLLARELGEGRIALGHGTRRGKGQLAGGVPVLHDPSGVLGIGDRPISIADVDPEVLQRWHVSWADWIDAHRLHETRAQS